MEIVLNTNIITRIIIRNQQAIRKTLGHIQTAHCQNLGNGLENINLLIKFPKYILSKANIISGGAIEAEKIANLFKPKQIAG